MGGSRIGPELLRVAPAQAARGWRGSFAFVYRSEGIGLVVVQTLEAHRSPQHEAGDVFSFNRNWLPRTKLLTVKVDSTPEPGALVEVRSRPWLVRDVRGTALPNDVLGAMPREGHHLVSLSSVEEDSLGEELQVVWEIEPGAAIRESFELPVCNGFDAPEQMDAFLAAVRWGAISQADSRAIQAPFRSGIQIEDYQLDPVVRCLQMPRTNLLVADDVGLGKTIEAGLVVQELILRNRVRTVLVVCPAALCVQWKDQMQSKFGLEFRIVDSQLLKDLRRRRGLFVNPWTHFPRLITSIDFLKRERPLRLLSEVLPGPGEPVYPRRFDLLIVDEAHNAAPAGSGNYAVDSQRTRALRLLAPHFEHRLFLTATPHNGYRESFTALLELLDNQRFARGVEPDLKQLEKVIVRRLKSELPPRWDGSPRFPERKLFPLEVRYSEEERSMHELLTSYGRLRRQGEKQGYAVEFVLKLMKKRLFSSPAAFLATLEQHRRSVEQRLAPSLPLTESVLRRQADDLEEEYADDEAYEGASEELMTVASGALRPLSPEEDAILKRLEEYAARATAQGDSKLSELMRWLDATLKPEGRWGDTRVIVFTEYRATQRWLMEKLAARGLGSDKRMSALYGGMASEDRERIKAAFQAHPDDSPVRLLLATDAASEGIDLQNHCSRLLHYEIPWNPNRLEQRNGRIDRHGQRESEVRVMHFVGQGYHERMKSMRERPPGDLEGDLEFLARVAAKVETIRQDLGKVGPILATRVQEAMVGRAVNLNTADAEATAARLRRYLKFEQEVRKQCEDLRATLEESRRELGLTGESVRRVVEVGLTLATQPPLRPISVTDHEGREVRAFQVPALRGSWSAALAGLEHPHTGLVRPVVFDEADARGRDDVVLCHLHHPLVQLGLRLLRAEIWGGGKLFRHTARLGNVSEPMVVAYGRLVVIGSRGHLLHEELVHAGGALRQGKLERLGVNALKEALREVGDERGSAFEAQAMALWPALKSPLEAALQARMRERTGNLASFLEKRCEREVDDMRAVLDDLARRIASELAEKPVEQLQLWTPVEKEQLERNRKALEVRLAEIPGESEREAETIRARYVDPEPRLFPVCVSWVFPQRMA